MDHSAWDHGDTPKSQKSADTNLSKSISIYFTEEVVIVKSCDWKSSCNTDTEAGFTYTLEHELPFT